MVKTAKTLERNNTHKNNTALTMIALVNIEQRLSHAFSFWLNCGVVVKMGWGTIFYLH